MSPAWLQLTPPLPVAPHEVYLPNQQCSSISRRVYLDRHGSWPLCPFLTLQDFDSNFDPFITEIWNKLVEQKSITKTKANFKHDTSCSMRPCLLDDGMSSCASDAIASTWERRPGDVKCSCLLIFSTDNIGSVIFIILILILQLL
jgi:hypothetical protein